MKNIPTYSLCHLDGHSNAQKELTVYRLQSFLDSHDNIKFPHRHKFYQLLFITSGRGEHVIDFESYEAREGVLFLLSPSQVHEWRFNPNVDGILINFNETLFSSFLANSSYLRDFSFFSGNSVNSFVDLALDRNSFLSMNTLFSRIETEYLSCNDCKTELIRALLLQVFIEVNYRLSQQSKVLAGKSNYQLFRNFEHLINLHYKIKRLPKDYAELLFITPNHLNALTNQIAGKSAGELIRNRIILEAKRLLVNSTFNIGEISLSLNFEDNSYFTRFFKKAEGVTPDEFRKLKASSFVFR